MQRLRFALMGASSLALAGACGSDETSSVSSTSASGGSVAAGTGGAKAGTGGTDAAGTGGAKAGTGGASAAGIGGVGGGTCAEPPCAPGTTRCAAAGHVEVCASSSASAPCGGWLPGAPCEAGTSCAGGTCVPSGTCVAGADCVSGEWCSASAGAAGGAGADYCHCPQTKPSVPVTFACGEAFPKGESGFVCYDPAGASCLVPGPAVVALLAKRVHMDCATLVSAGANPVKTSAGVGPHCCYMVSFAGCP